jgi:hypothetical protein
MRQVPGKRSRMSGDRCALGQSFVLGPRCPEASGGSDLAGNALDTPSRRANRACAAGGGLLVFMNNIHSYGPMKTWSGGVDQPVRPTSR